MTTDAENTNPPKAMIGDPPAATSLEGQLMTRRERRKTDLLSVDGLTRENARQWRRYKAGSITEREWSGFLRFSYLQLASLRTRHGIETIERESLPAIAAQDVAEPPSLLDCYRTLAFVRPALAQSEPPAAQAPESIQ